MAAQGGATTTTFTNQQAINVLFALAAELGFGGGDLLDWLGWNDLVTPNENRRRPFDSSRLEQRPGVTDAQWYQIVAALRAPEG